MITDRAGALAADSADPLAGFRDHYAIDPAGPLYFDGNSLGRLPAATPARVAEVLAEWGSMLVGAWDRWIDMPERVGDRIGTLVGASPGEVRVGDSTTVNLYKLAVAALDARADRRVVVTDAHDFPTVRYVIEGLADARRLEVRHVASDPVEGIDPDALGDALAPDVALVCLSGANYRSGARLDLPAVSALARDVGAMTLFDLSHAAGAFPVGLDAAGVDLAVGCCYKYLCGGPGAPAWQYVRAGLHASLRQPIWGWWGQAEQFSMGPSYDPVPSATRFLAGTPAVLGMVAVDSGLDALCGAGIEAVGEKTAALVGLLARRAAERLVPLGARVASPTDPPRRGGHLALSHPLAREAVAALAERGLLIADFRPPDVLRLSAVALSTRYVDAWDALEHIAGVLGELGAPAPAPSDATSS